MYTDIWAPRSMSQPSTERNSTLPLPALFVGRWLLAEQPEILMQRFAFVSLLHWELHWTPWNFLWFDVGTPHLIGDTHGPCFQHHVPCHNPALSETAPCSCQPCLSVDGCLLNNRKLWCSGLLLSAFSAELALNAVKLPLVFVGASNTTSQTFEHHVPCHNTTPWETARRIEDHFSGSQNRAPAAWCVCVWKSLNQRVSAGGHPSHHWWMANEEDNDESCKRTCEFPTSGMARWLSHKPPLPTWHGNITLHDFISSRFILSLRGVSKCVYVTDIITTASLLAWVELALAMNWGQRLNAASMIFLINHVELWPPRGLKPRCVHPAGFHHTYTRYYKMIFAMQCRPMKCDVMNVMQTNLI